MTQTVYNFNGGFWHLEVMGRRCYIEQRTSHDWRGWFDDDHSVEYAATTKTELLADMRNDS